MNARSQIFELTVEGRQIEEVVAAIFHTVLLHRTTGKYTFKPGGIYTLGTIGTIDVDCDFIDFTYVCVASSELNEAVRREVALFRDTMRSGEVSIGQISLEFYQKKRARWLFPSECIPWEVWTLKLEVVELANEHERQVCRQNLSELLSQKIIYICEVMNRHEYTPKLPEPGDLDQVFETNISDAQPYLFKIAHSISGTTNPSVGDSMRKLIKDKLAL